MSEARYRSFEAGDVDHERGLSSPQVGRDGLVQAKRNTTADPVAMLETVKARYALRRVAEPREVAAAILWHTSDESSYVTGTAVAVDGGRTFH